MVLQRQFATKFTTANRATEGPYPGVNSDVADQLSGRTKCLSTLHALKSLLGRVSAEMIFYGHRVEKLLVA